MINFCFDYDIFKNVKVFMNKSYMFANRKLLLSVFFISLATPHMAFGDELGLSPISSDPVYEFEANIGLGLEYNDNIDDVSTNPESSFITNISPNFTFRRLGGRIQADINYSGYYSIYLKSGLDPEYRHSLNASLSANVIEDLFFLDISESLEQVYEDPSLTEFEAIEDVGDSRNRNVITISPYFSLNPSQRTNIKLGYTFVDTRYSLEETGRSSSFISFNSKQYDFRYNENQTHEVYGRINHTLNDNATIFAGGSYSRQLYADEDDVDNTRYTGYIGASYVFSEKLSVSLEAGPNYSVPDEGDSKFSPYVQASLNYTVGRSSFVLSYNTSFEDDFEDGKTINKSTYSFNWIKELDRSNFTIGISYNTYDSNVSYSRLSSSTENGNTFAPKLTLNHEFTERTSAFASYNGVIYEDSELGDHRHIGRYGFRYNLSENSNITLSHTLRYTIPSEEDSYISNQVMFDFMYSF